MSSTLSRQMRRDRPNSGWWHAHTACGMIPALLAGALAGTEVQAADEPQDPLSERTGENASVVLSKILVTGEKVTRAIEDTSSSVEVYDSARLDALPHTDGVQDLLQQTPNVVDTGIGNELPTVRGIDGSGPVTGAYAFLSGTRPRLNLSIDGRALTYNELAFGLRSLWDVDQVEIYRGPQSYIQGRNAIAGAVIMTTKKPTFHWEGAVKGSLGEQDFSQTAAALSGPLLENELAFRLSVDRQKRTSYVDMESYAPVGDPREVETSTARAKLLYEPERLPGLSTMLSVTYYDTHAPQSEAQIAPAGQSSRYSNYRPVFANRSTSGAWDMSLDVDDGLRFENTLTYTDFSTERLAYAGLPTANIDGEEFQIEPRVHFKGMDGRLRGLAGVRYFSSKQDESVYLSSYYGENVFDDKTETASAYAELTYALHPSLDVTLAGRFEREHRERVGGSSSITVDFDEVYEVFLPKLDVAWTPKQDLTLGAKIAGGYNPGGAGITFAAPIVNYAFDEEHVWNYELYSRQRLDGGRLELTSNVFFNDYSDMQLPYSLASGSTVVRNADKVETYGAEVGARWRPISDLDLFGSIGLLKTDIKRFSNSGIEGNVLPRAPDFTASMGATYVLGHGFELSGTVRYSDSYYSEYDNDPDGEISAYWLANVQLAYNFRNGRATLFANNLFDDDSRILVVDNDTSSPTLQQPRLIGASVEFYF
ncbi:TonB-dependent receptor [Thiorhodococcus fuscus]|uniref:TonB-dependent receptor n=1 Tax=Thiorhodococcus fuscus TaxID=527200 RepID=A0ABW4Y8A0_9GAMM